MRTVRYLLGAAIPPLAAGIVGGIVLFGPWSAFALDGANARWVAGDARGAFESYVAVAEGWHTPGTRAEAAARAGLLALASHQKATGARWLRRAVDLEPDADTRSGLRRRLAAVYIDDLDDPVRAADTYALAAREGEDRGTAYLLAARAYERAERFDAARDAYAEAGRLLPEGPTRDDAWAGEGRAAARLPAGDDDGASYTRQPRGPASE